MKKSARLAAAFVLTSSTGSTLALETAPPAPIFTSGFYVGLNAGYGGGGSSRASVFAVPENGVELFSVAPPGAFAPTWLFNTATVALKQNGFIGGGQLGYNFLWDQNVLFGLEADFQGATIGGKGAYAQGASQSVSLIDPPVRCFTGASCGFLNAMRTFNSQRYDISRSVAGAGEVSSSVDWLGTVRGRVGYLVTPALLVYGSGGLAYGGVRASTANMLWFAQTTVLTNTPRVVGPPPGQETSTTVSPGAGGAVSYADTRVGWTAGGGVEWMFAPRWSLKAEAYYYDLGSVAFQAHPVGVLSQFGGFASLNRTLVRVNYDGVIARAGINYHLNWAGPGTVFAGL